jgi:cell division topological specificity factor
MKLFNRSRRGSALIARERLKILFAHERVASSGQPDLLGILHDEILAVISRHVSFAPDKVQIKMARRKSVSTLAVDIEIPTGLQDPIEVPQHGRPAFEPGRNDSRSEMNQGVF